MPHEPLHQASSRAVLSLGAALIGAISLGLTGCSSPSKPQGERFSATDSEQRAADKAFTREPFEDQVRAGVLRQRAIFDYHFEADTAVLNSLGRRDLAILADAMGTTGGRIAVQRGSAGKDLYGSRLEAVRAYLASIGVEGKRIKIGDGAPGGVGVATGRAIMIHAKMSGAPMRSTSGEILSNTPSADEGGEE